MSWSRARLLDSVALLALCAGCAEPTGLPPRAPTLDPFGRRVAEPNLDSLRRDPLGYLREVTQRCSELSQYTMLFTRQERRGLFSLLRGPERIACWIRREPFSVRMKWLDDHVKYGESSYIAGQFDGRVRFVPRRGLFGGPPPVATVDVNTPVAWGEARYPITQFGLERAMDRVLLTISAAEPNVIVQYAGLVRPPSRERLAHLVRVEFPDPREPLRTRELYTDPDTHLPTAIISRTRSGQLDSAYWFDDINPLVSLDDRDFALETAAAAGTGT